MLSAGEMVLTRSQQSALLSGNTGGSGVTNVNITVTSMNPDDVIAAIRKYERSNGKQWATA